MEHSNIRDLVYIAAFAALIAVCSWISIPAAVPFTMQTFAVFAALGLLGGKRGTFAVLIYLLLGAVGLPVFAGFKAGLGALLGTTGGYLVGFVFAGLIYLAAEKIFGGRTAVKALAMLAGLAACYAFGTGWFMTVYAKANGPVSLGTVLGWCVLPFVVPDLVKIGLALLLTGRLKRFVH